MKVLIIGGTSLIGPHVIHELYSSVPSVTVTTLTRSGKNFFCETSLTADRHDTKRFEEILRAEDPDILIDMIAFTQEEAELTSQAIRNINPDLPVIVISSIDVYAAYAKIFKTENIDYQNCPIEETGPLRTALGFEGKKYDKLNVEKTYISHLQNVTILRIPAIYGWPDTTRVELYLDPMLNGAPQITLSEDSSVWKFSRALHKNIAHAIVSVMTSHLVGIHIFNVAEENAYTNQEWCRKIAEICGWKGEIVISKTPDSTTDYKQPFYVSSQKIRDKIGYKEKYDPDEGLMETIKFHAYIRQKRNYKKDY